MHEFASLNFQLKSVSEIFLPAISPATFYGRSVFTTIAVYHGGIFQWEKHWRRLNQSAARLKIDLSAFSETQIKTSAEKLIDANNFQNGRMRLTIFDDQPDGIWAVNRKNSANLLITTADFRQTADKIRLTISPFPVNSKSPLAGLKSGSYLENILALEDSRRRGFDEAARVNENDVIVSTAMTNLFWVKDQTIYTPPLETGALNGTTREFIKENFQVAETKIMLAELYSADEIFLTSAGVGVRQVELFDARIFTDFTVSDRVQKFFNETVGKVELR